jgi:hypothetical protein
MVASPVLSHVYWIAGAPDAGKSTVAARLAKKHGFDLYHQDDAQAAQFARYDPLRHPHTHAFQVMTMDQRWVLRSPADMAQSIIASGSERMSMVVEDLLAYPADRPIVTEGPWLFPDDILPLLSRPRQAVWLVPSDEFKRASAARRDKPTIRYQTSDPQRASQNWLERDRLLTEYLRHRVGALGLTLIDVDGSKSIDEMLRIVESHFALED